MAYLRIFLANKTSASARRRAILRSRPRFQHNFDSLDALRAIWRRSNVRWQDACHGPTQELPIEPGRSFRCGLFARSAGVHVDFHAHRHFDNFWSFPGHFILPSLARNSALNLNLGPRSISRKCGASNSEHLKAKPGSRYFSPGQNDFFLGQGPANVGQSTDKFASSSASDDDPCVG